MLDTGQASGGSGPVHYNTHTPPLTLLNPFMPAQVKPEAMSYYELGAATLKFTFPEPAPLDGVSSRQKSILNMK